MLYVIDSDIIQKIIDIHVSSHDIHDISQLKLLMKIFVEIINSEFNDVSVNDDNFLITYEKLIKSSFVQENKDAEYVLRYIAERYVEFYNEIDKLAIHSLVSWTIKPKEEGSEVIDLKKNKVIVSLDAKSMVRLSEKIDFQSKISLVVENPTDFKLYENFVSNFSPTRKSKINLNMVNGGGGAIASAMDGEISINKRLVVAITDSDKKNWETSSALYKSSSTAEKAVREAQKLNNKYSAMVAHVCILPVGEKENLFDPFEYIKVFENSDKIHQSTLKVLQELLFDFEKTNNECILSFLNFFDYKNGLSDTDINKINSNNPHFIQSLRDSSKKFENIFKREIILKGIGTDPVKRFFPVSKSGTFDYFDGKFRVDLLNQTSYIHRKRKELAKFLYSIGFSYFHGGSI